MAGRQAAAGIPQRTHSTMQKRLRVLLVEDDADQRELTEIALRQTMACELRQAERLSEALECLEQAEYDVVLLDLGLPDSDGLETIAAVRKATEVTPIVVLTGLNDEQTALQSLNDGAQDYLPKNLSSPDALARTIRYAIQRQQLLRELTMATNLLEKKNHRLAELYDTAYRFVDNVSHEFRTPLTVIKEYVALLRECLLGDLNQQQCKFLDIISDRADDLNNMVDDMLDVSKLEAGLLGLHRRRCHPEDVIERMRMALARKAAVRGVSLDLDMEGSLPETYCDPEKIGRVIINLTVNAIKFCRDPGQVRIWARYDRYSDDVVIGVTDNGPGIDHRNLSAIFERFRQGNTSCRTSTKGFGLGLNIAKELVDLNFGQMQVESTPGQGSTFFFTVPRSDYVNIVHRYLQRIEDISANCETVALVEISVANSCDSDRPDELDVFLNSLIRRNDLVFRVERHRWLFLLAIEACELVKFRERLSKEHGESNRNRPRDPLPQLEIRELGHWTVATHYADIVREFSQQLPNQQTACV
jgi:signal transduction histidine kinase